MPIGRPVVDDLDDLVVAALSGGQNKQSSLPEREVLQWAQAQKVLPQVLSSLHSTSAIKNQHLAWLQALRVHLLDTQRTIAERSHSAGIQLAFLKGFSFEERYPPGQSRYFNDLDIQLASLSDYWRLHSILQGMGFTLEVMTLVRHAQTGLVSGAATYRNDEVTCDTWMLRVDVQIASIVFGRGKTYLLEPDFWNSLRQCCDGSPARSPDWRYDLVIFATEIEERKEILVRDLIDFVRLTAFAQSSEIPWVIKELDRSNLTRNFRRIGKEIFRRRGMMKLASVSCLSFLDALSELRPRSNQPEYRRQSFIPRDALIQPYRQVLPSVLRHLIASRLDPRFLFNSTMLTQFIPISENPRGALSWWDVGSHQILRTPIGCFLPVFFGATTRETVDRVQQICDAVAASLDDETN